MPDLRFFHPVEVRYGDLDPQGHVNNAKFMTYMEQARIAYVRHLDLWQPGSYLTLGMIVADVQITFLKPILLGQPVRVWAGVERLGNKSMTMKYRLDHAETGALFATGTSVQVAYDYTTGQTIPIPPNWRQAITQWEGLEER